jgi:tRNA 2-thiocytidine biosynthesis protein TtcA
MRNLTKTGSRINSKIGKAIHDYNLIEPGDKILVAVSGGKDSLTLLTLLKSIQSWAPVDFEIFAAHIISDFHCSGYMHEDFLKDIFNSMDIRYVFKEIKVLDDKGKTSCFWCSWNRRKALFELADENGCKKVALGHHKDDIAETMLMNLFYNGEISAMNPRQELFEGKITVIRPLCYVEEKIIKQFAKESEFPEQLCSCPFGKDSRRKYVKDLIRETERRTPKINIKTNIFNSIARIKKDYTNLKEEREDKSKSHIDSSGDI